MNSFGQPNPNNHFSQSSVQDSFIQNSSPSNHQGFHRSKTVQLTNPIVFRQEMHSYNDITSCNLRPIIPPMKRSYDSRSSSASPDSSNQSTPKKRNTSQSNEHSPDFSFHPWNNSPSPDTQVDIVNINILNATYFKCKNDLLLIHKKKSQAQNKLKYLLEDILPNRRSKIPFFTVKDEHIFEVMSTVNFFYKNVSQEVQQGSQELHRIVALNNHNMPNNQGLSITVGNLLAKSKQQLQDVELLHDLDVNMIGVIINMLEKILNGNFNSKYEVLIAQMNCWLLDLLVNLMPGYIHRLMKVSASREARGVSVKEFRSRKRCLADWVAVEKSLNGAKVDIYTTLNRFTAVVGVSAMLQFSERENQIKEVISNNINDHVVQETYNICQGLEEVMEPLRLIQKVLGFCLINDENLSTLMIDPIHNPLFEKRLHSYRTGPSSSFPKKMISELENSFHQDFIQGATFFATQQYERRCATCQKSLGQECLLCTGCNLVRYCGESCAKEEEVNHNKICCVDRFSIIENFLDKLSEDKNCLEIEVV